MPSHSRRGESREVGTAELRFDLGDLLHVQLTSLPLFIAGVQKPASGATPTASIDDVSEPRGAA